jgi:hypothetical protein
MAVAATSVPTTGSGMVAERTSVSYSRTMFAMIVTESMVATPATTLGFTVVIV